MSDAGGSETLARRLPPTLVSSIAIISIAGVFVGVTVLGQRYSGEIDGMARSLATDAAPAIEQLSAARGALHRLTSATRDELRAAEAGRARDRAPVESARTALDAAMAGYLALPPYPGEPNLQRPVLAAVDDSREALDLVLDRLDAGDIGGAHALMREKLMPASDRADRGIEQLEWLNADYARHTGASIKRTRRQVSHLTYELAALGAVAALVVLLLAWWANRGYAEMAAARARLESVRKRLAERRAQELELFAARVAHDLRNPLASIAMRVTLAAQEVGDPLKTRAALARVGTVVGRATQIIDGLLDFARAGGIADPEAHADASAAIRAAIDDLAQEIERAGIALSVEMPPVAGVRCSAGALASVVGNLLRNAIKFMADTPAGERSLVVRVVESEAGERIEIEDSGPGVPPDSAQRIFEPWVRLAPARQPGIGLGLATVKRLVEAHGGAVGVREAAGRGSCFWFELPKLPTAPALERVIDSPQGVCQP